MRDYSILIADPDPDFIRDFSGTLIGNGFQATGTSSGSNALEIYKKAAADLVLADLAIFELDGLRLLEALRSFDPNARVILTTDSADKDMIARGFRLGALDILEKPLESEFLISKIRELLAREDRALEGNLQMMSLASIIQINCEERNQAQLILNHMGQGGTIFFKDGEMIHAEYDGLQGEDAVYGLLSWDRGTFKLKIGVDPRQRTINKTWSGVLLEGMRRIDEKTAGWSPDWEEEEDLPLPREKNSGLEDRIVNALGNLRDVEEALICFPDGTVAAEYKSTDPEGFAGLGGIIQEEAKIIGSFLDGGTFERAVLTGDGNRVYVQFKEERSIYLTLSIKSSAESIYGSVETILKRY